MNQEQEPTLIERLRDHSFKEEMPSIAEQKVLRNEAAGVIEDLEKAVLIYMDENPVDLTDSDFFGTEEFREQIREEAPDFKFEFQDGPFGTADEMRIKWFIWYTNGLQPDWGKSTFVSPWSK